MTKPIDQVLDKEVVWKECSPSGCVNGLHATHEGIWNSPFGPLRCYVLSDGQRVFDAADFERYVLGLS